MTEFERLLRPARPEWEERDEIVLLLLLSSVPSVVASSLWSTLSRSSSTSYVRSSAHQNLSKFLIWREYLFYLHQLCKHEFSTSEDGLPSSSVFWRVRSATNVSTFPFKTQNRKLKLASEMLVRFLLRCFYAEPNHRMRQNTATATASIQMTLVLINLHITISK